MMSNVLRGWARFMLKGNSLQALFATMGKTSQSLRLYLLTILFAVGSIPAEIISLINYAFDATNTEEWDVSFSCNSIL